ncbi:MAG: DUF2892 domain-containing protein [Archangium sp.]
MCKRASCPRCGKVTWAGCGAHVDAVMAGVPEADRCKCGQGKKRDAAPSTSALINEGPIDRALRVILGAGVVSLAVVGPQTPWAWLGLIPLITGLVGFCPLYRLLGISTTGVRPGRV